MEQVVVVGEARGQRTRAMVADAWPGAEEAVAGEAKGAGGRA
jgi:hypothetical protein